MKAKRRTKRARKARKKARLEETSKEMDLRLSKMRGGRPTQVIKDKKKYDRKKEKKIIDDE